MKTSLMNGHGDIYEDVVVAFKARKKVKEAQEEASDKETDAVEQPKQSKSGKIRRNDPCPCGSGDKFKKCCLMKHKGFVKVVIEDEEDG